MTNPSLWHFPMWKAYSSRFTYRWSRTHWLSRDTQVVFTTKTEYVYHFQFLQWKCNQLCSQKYNRILYQGQASEVVFCSFSNVGGADDIITEETRSSFGAGTYNNSLAKTMIETAMIVDVGVLLFGREVAEALHRLDIGTVERDKRCRDRTTCPRRADLQPRAWSKSPDPRTERRSSLHPAWRRDACRRPCFSWLLKKKSFDLRKPWHSLFSIFEKVVGEIEPRILADGTLSKRPLVVKDGIEDELIHASVPFDHECAYARLLWDAPIVSAVQLQVTKSMSIVCITKESTRLTQTVNMFYEVRNGSIHPIGILSFVIDTQGWVYLWIEMHLVCADAHAVAVRSKTLDRNGRIRQSDVSAYNERRQTVLAQKKIQMCSECHEFGWWCDCDFGRRRHSNVDDVWGRGRNHFDHWILFDREKKCCGRLEPPGGWLPSGWTFVYDLPQDDECLLYTIVYPWADFRKDESPNEVMWLLSLSQTKKLIVPRWPSKTIYFDIEESLNISLQAIRVAKRQ